MPHGIRIRFKGRVPRAYKLVIACVGCGWAAIGACAFWITRNGTQVPIADHASRIRIGRTLYFVGQPIGAVMDGVILGTIVGTLTLVALAHYYVRVGIAEEMRRGDANRKLR